MPAARRGRRTLAATLGSLHGLPQKVGQLLALGELEQGDRVFSALTEGGVALEAGLAQRELAKALGRPVETVFRALDPRGLAASLGQVHRATLHDGREVAVKLQYPGIADAVKVDLGALGLIGKVYRRGYDLRAYREALGEMITRELDYRLEAQALSHFGRLVRDDATFVTPALVPELSNERLLVMSWLEGAPLDEAKAWPLAQREAAARGLVRLFLRSVLEWGVVHADLHAGNVRFFRDGRVGLLDFGCVQALDPSVAGGLRLLFEGVVAAEAPPAHWLARYAALGFSPTLLEPVVPELAAVTRLLLAPLLTDAPFDAGTWELNAGFKALLGERRYAFRFAAPASFVFVTRAFVTLAQTLKALAAPVAWRPLFDAVVGRSTHTPPSAFALTPTLPAEGPTVVPLATHLRIRVTRDDGTRIDLTFGAAATANLPGLVPPEVMPRLTARGFDVEAITARALAQRCAPGPLFDLLEPGREMRVWLD